MLYMADAYTGKAHVTADQVGDYNAGISGADCVLNIGEKLRAEILSANKVRIYDGVFLFSGRRSGITAGSYEDVIIENGTQAQKRNDLICAKYEKDSATSRENLTLTVIKGTPGSTAADPAVPEGTIRGGSAACYMPLYRVKLDGVNLTAVERIPPIRMTAEEMEEELASLNDRLKKRIMVEQITVKGIGQSYFYIGEKDGYVLMNVYNYAREYNTADVVRISHNVAQKIYYVFVEQVQPTTSSMALPDCFGWRQTKNGTQSS